MTTGNIHIDKCIMIKSLDYVGLNMNVKDYQGYTRLTWELFKTKMCELEGSSRDLLVTFYQYRLLCAVKVRFFISL